MERTGRRLSSRVEPSALFATAIVAMTAGAVSLGPAPALGGASGAAAGWALVLFGVLLHRSASARFRRVGTTLATLDVPAALVDDGVFGFTRNPMYLAGVPILLGWAVVLGHPLLLTAAVLWIPIAEALWIRPEERLLRATFGAEWDDYRARVRRWL